MKHAPILLLFTLAACGDSKPAPAPAKAASADVGVATKPVEPVASAPSNVTPAVAEAQRPESTPSEAPVPAIATAVAVDEPKPAPDEHASTAKEAQPTAGEKPEKKSADAPAKHSDAKAAVVPAKVEELSVQVLQEGTGAVVKRGDTVTLEYTISYMPKPATDKKEDAKKPAKGAKKPEAKKPDEKKSEEGKPKDEPKEGEKPAEEKKEPALADHKGETADKTEEKPEGDKHAEAKTTEAKPEDAKAAEAKPAEPLKPVVVASTKSLLTPFTVKLSENSKPKLMPGLVRGVEGLKVGSRALIRVPAALAYGKDGNKSAGIPPETTVEIEVFVKDARE